MYFHKPGGITSFVEERDESLEVLLNPIFLETFVRVTILSTPVASL
jgi:hypothetical protein